MLEITVALLVLAAGLALYVVRVNAVMLRTPSEAEAHAGKPLTAERIRRALGEVKESGIDWYDNLPPRKERRYVIVGGSGELFCACEGTWANGRGLMHRSQVSWEGSLRCIS